MMWTAEMDDRLRALYALDLSTRAIGEKMGLTKNAVIGRSRRLGLTRRSPIKGKPQRLALPRTDRDASNHGRGALIGPTLVLLGATPPVEPAKPRVAARRGTIPCCWPIGEPRTPGFRYCNAPDVVEGRAYCAEHCAVAYQPVRHRTEAEVEADAERRRMALAMMSAGGNAWRSRSWQR